MRPEIIMDFDALFKIIVLGDSGVGKTNLIARYTRDHFIKESKTTVGVEFACKTLEFQEKEAGNIVLKVQLWDTAGQERFRSIATAYYRGAHGSLLCYDVTNRRSFESLEGWIQELKSTGESDCVNVLVGTKCDLDSMRAISTEEAKSFAESHQMLMVETSALNKINVDQVFELLIRHLYARNKEKILSQKKVYYSDQISKGIRIQQEERDLKNKTSNWLCC